VLFFQYIYQTRCWHVCTTINWAKWTNYQFLLNGIPCDMQQHHNQRQLCHINIVSKNLNKAYYKG